MTTLKERLFPEFAPVSTADWMAKITVDLKGVPFEKKLIWKTGEGFDVNPFYRAEDLEGLPSVASMPGEFPFVRGTKRDNHWKVRQDIHVHNFAAANAQALDLIQKGVNALGFHFAGDTVNAANLATLLQGVNPETVELNFETCPRQASYLLEHLVAYFDASDADTSKCRGSV
ncbi:MAG: methylmalonyl-CoA mutase family protein, partial [Tannerella sp.]|nr:methylmalonyl-CoA mutase family protein [Tannerella sp.]